MPARLSESFCKCLIFMPCSARRTFKIAGYYCRFAPAMILITILGCTMSYESEPASGDSNRPLHLQLGDTLCVLIHGFASGPQEMNYLAKYLAGNGLSVRSLLLKGHGSSPDDLACAKWTDWESQVDSVLRDSKQQYKNVFLIGFSMGSLLAIRAGMRHEVDGVVAISPSLYMFDKNIYRLPLRKGIQLASRLFPTYTRKVRNYTYRGVSYQRSAYAKVPLSAIDQMLGLADSTRSTMESFSRPILIIYAKDDKTCDFEGSLEIHDTIRSTKKKIVELRRGGHLITLNDSRDKVFEEIKSFIISSGNVR